MRCTLRGCVCLDVAAFVADGDFHVHAKIIAAGAGGDVKQRAIARFGLRFHPDSGAAPNAVEPFGELAPVQQKFIERVGFIVFHHIKNTNYSNRAPLYSRRLCPIGRFSRRDFLPAQIGVEAHAVLFWRRLCWLRKWFSDGLAEFDVFGVVAHFYAAGFGRFGHAVDADGEKLLVERDKAGI